MAYYVERKHNSRDLTAYLLAIIEATSDGNKLKVTAPAEFGEHYRNGIVFADLFVEVPTEPGPPRFITRDDREKILKALGEPA